MDQVNPENALAFMELVNNLKHSSRRGWPQRGVENHEQISSHMYGMAMMTFLLGDNSQLDRLKCLQLALVHDLAESIVGDITPDDNIPPTQKHEMEDRAMKDITSSVGDIGKLIYDFYKEYESQQTPEAKFVKDLDRFDMLFSATHYELRDRTPRKLQEFFESAKDKIEDKGIRKMVDLLEAKRDELQKAVEQNEEQK